MRNRFLSLVAMLSMAVVSMADNVPGLTVEYLDEGTGAYVQAISAVGRIEFKDGNAFIVFKDADAGTEDLGAISAIHRISFGNVDDSDITSDSPTSLAPERSLTVTAYPNPTADHIHINGLQQGQQVRLFTSGGRLVVICTSPDIDLSGMSSGVYLLQVGKDVIKIVKK